MCVIDKKNPQSRAGSGVGILIILVLMISVTISQSLAQDRGAIVPPGWNPSLGEPLAFMEEEANAKAQPSQQFLNRTSQSLADVRDAQLFITYIFLMQVSDPAERTALFQEQQEWLKQRQEQAQQAVKSEGGSLQPLEYSSAFRQITETRLATLQKRLTEKCSKTSDIQK